MTLLCSHHTASHHTTPHHTTPQLSGWLMLLGGVWLHVRKESLFFSPLLLTTHHPSLLLSTHHPSFFFTTHHPSLLLDRFSFCLVAVGALVVVMSFLGCCGACTESVCFLTFVCGGSVTWCGVVWCGE